MHPGKAKPSSPPPRGSVWAFVGSVPVFPGMGTGLRWGVLGQGRPGARAGVRRGSSIACRWCLGRGGGSPALALGAGITPAPQHCSFPSRNGAVGAAGAAGRSQSSALAPSRRPRPRRTQRGLGQTPLQLHSPACSCPVPPWLRVTPLLCTPAAPTDPSKCLGEGSVSRRVPLRSAPARPALPRHHAPSLGDAGGVWGVLGGSGGLCVPLVLSPPLGHRGRNRGSARVTPGCCSAWVWLVSGSKPRAPSAAWGEAPCPWGWVGLGVLGPVQDQCFPQDKPGDPRAGNPSCFPSPGPRGHWSSPVPCPSPGGAAGAWTGGAARAERLRRYPGSAAPRRTPPPLHAQPGQGCSATRLGRGVLTSGASSPAQAGAVPPPPRSPPAGEQPSAPAVLQSLRKLVTHVVYQGLM